MFRSFSSESLLSSWNLFVVRSSSPRKNASKRSQRKKERKKEKKKERKKKGEKRKKKKEKSTMALRWLLRVERSFFPGCAIVSSLSPFFFFFSNFLNSILPCFRYFLTPLLRRRCIHKRTLLRVASTRWYWWGKLNWETPYLLVFVNVQNCFV